MINQKMTLIFKNWLQLETKLYTRNSRLKSNLFSMVILYFLFIISLHFNMLKENVSFYFIFSMIWNGGLNLLIFMYMPSLESDYFDKLATMPFIENSYYDIKFKLLIFTTCILHILLLGTFYFIEGPKNFIYLFAGFIINLGVIIPLSLIVSTCSPKYFNINTTTRFTYQGNSKKSVFIMFVMIFCSQIILHIGKNEYFFNKVVNYVIIISLIGFMLSPIWLYIARAKFRRQRYIILDSFRMKL